MFENWIQDVQGERIPMLRFTYGKFLEGEVELVKMMSGMQSC